MTSKRKSFFIFKLQSYGACRRRDVLDIEREKENDCSVHLSSFAGIKGGGNSGLSIRSHSVLMPLQYDHAHSPFMHAAHLRIITSVVLQINTDIRLNNNIGINIRAIVGSLPIQVLSLSMQRCPLIGFLLQSLPL